MKTTKIYYSYLRFEYTHPHTHTHTHANTSVWIFRHWSWNEVNSPQNECLVLGVTFQCGSSHWNLKQQLIFLIYHQSPLSWGGAEGRCCWQSQCRACILCLAKWIAVVLTFRHVIYAPIVPRHFFIMEMFGVKEVYFYSFPLCTTSGLNGQSMKDGTASAAARALFWLLKWRGYFAEQTVFVCSKSPFRNDRI